jgi:hypothetical protein
MRAIIGTSYHTSYHMSTFLFVNGRAPAEQTTLTVFVVIVYLMAQLLHH